MGWVVVNACPLSASSASGLRPRWQHNHVHHPAFGLVHSPAAFRGLRPCTACGCSHSLAQPAAGHSVGDSKTQSGGRGLRPSQSCAPSGLRSTKSQPPALHSLRLLAQLAPEERVCRFAPRSRFAPEQCVSFCRFAPRSRLQRQRGRDSVRIISLRSRLDPRAGREGRACCGAKCCSQHAPRRTRSLRSARGRLSLGGFASFFPVKHTDRAGVVCLDLERKGRTDGRTERAPPMGPPPTHVCLVRETRLLPPKAGRLASRSAKPTLDGSSLIMNGHGAHRRQEGNWRPNRHARGESQPRRNRGRTAIRDRSGKLRQGG